MKKQSRLISPNTSRFVSQASLFFLIILFNNCSASKWSTELSPELNLNNGSTAIGDREPSASNVCRVSQISTGQIILSESLYFNVISSDLDLVKLQVSCDQGQIWQNISYSPQQAVIAVSNLAVGNYICSVRLLNQQNVPFSCEGFLSVNVLSAQPQPGPIPAPNPVPTPETPPSNPIGGSGLYTTDENLPDQLSTFTVLRGYYLNNHHVVAETGMSALRFPSNWNVMGPADSIRLAVLVPPGVSSVGWSNEFNSLSQLFGTCDEDGLRCHDQSYTPSLWPVSIGKPLFDPTFNPATAEATSVPRIVFLTIKSTGKEGWLMSLNVTYYVKDAAMYERWRSQRKWAGGSGDCDGLGNKYLTGPSCSIKGW